MFGRKFQADVWFTTVEPPVVLLSVVQLFVELLKFSANNVILVTEFADEVRLIDSPEQMEYFDAAAVTLEGVGVMVTCVDCDEVQPLLVTVTV